MTTIRPNGVDNMLKGVEQVGESKSVKAAEAQLKELFVQKGTMNEGSDGAEKIQAQIQILTEKISKLEKQAQDKLQEIEDKQGKINDKGEDLGDAVANLATAQGNYQDAIKDAAHQAARTAVREFKPSKGKTFKQFFNQEFQKQLNTGVLGAEKAKLMQAYNNYINNQDQIAPLADEIERAIGEVQGLQSQVQTINATKSLLMRTKSVMEQSLVPDAYQNCDTDNSIPMFSGKKAEFANSLLAKYTSRSNTDAAPGVDLDATTGNADKIAEAKGKWENFNTAEYKTGDLRSAQSNPELANLREAFKGGMLDDLQASGMSANDIIKFVADNWNVGIEPKNGGWNIPKGHSSDAWVHEPVFEALEKIGTNGASANATAESVNQNQMAEMKKAVEEDGILTQLYEQGFTFKEAMYTMSKLFPDAGIQYDPTKSGRSYQMVEDDEKSGELYKTIGDQVLNYWNVGSEPLKMGPSEPVPVTKYDPITWQDGDTTYTFVIDRNNDGKFDYNSADDNELLGSQGGMEELLKYDDDGDGKLSAKEMADHNIIIMANKQSESVDSADDVDGYKNGPGYTNSVSFGMSYHNAEDLGIKDIDIRGAAKGSGNGEAIGSSTKEYDGYDEAYEDINGSSVINTFTINKADGSTIEAKETLNTEENLNTFYGSVAKAASKAGQMSIKFSDGDVKAAIDGAEGSEKIDAVLERLNELKEQHKNDAQNNDDVPIDVDFLAGYEQFIKDYTDGAMNAAEEAAEKNRYDEEDAVDATDEALDQYYKENPIDKKPKAKDDEEK